MTLIDTHCHLYLKEFAGEWPELIARAEKEGVKQFYFPGIDSSIVPDMLEMERQFQGRCHAMMGLHPCYVSGNYKEELTRVDDWLKLRPFAAVGEIGLDFYWDRTYEKQQFEAFHQQIEWALAYDLPIVIHSRDSMPESIGVVREHQKGALRGIFHCFSGTYESARTIIDLGLYLGIGGVLTYKNAGLAEAIKDIDLEHIVLETDAPYLTPVPFRGKRNESSYIKLVAEKLAAVKGVSLETVAAITTANAQKIFGT